MISVADMPKICVILGAGASSDVHNGSAPIQNQGNYRPPLARDLFAIQRHPEYFNILNRYSGAKALAAILSPLSDSTEFNLETRLRELAEHSDERVRQQFKFVPPYLRDLIWRASYNYTATPGTYLQMIFTLLSDFPHHVLFLVLNYDTLLEQALNLFPKIEFQSVASYVMEGQQAKIVKLHGSIDWFKLIGSTDESWDELVLSQDVLAKTPDNEIYLHNTGDQLMSVAITNNRPYPILTAPLAGKKPEDLVCPQTHIQAAKEFLGDCKKFLIIGTSGLDEDLLTFLDEAVAPARNAVLQLVGVSESENALKRFETGVGAFRNKRITPPGYLFTDGFRHYIDTGQLAAFARFDPP